MKNGLNLPQPITANLIVESALERKESRGGHSRSDYKNKSEKSEHSTIVKQNIKELVYAK